ncbi:Rpp4C4, putative [Medicago truncatula]|uniref:Rpp4C4, putative n=1 Tax=Medicago truncatula TaxID=3880 RepID=A0A072TPM9_MEDTR|nr:Rpp4C4, putative [Medicago truncatula]
MHSNWILLAPLFLVFSPQAWFHIKAVGFGSFKHLKLSEYPELKELWYGRLENNTFRSLKYLVVHKCDFLFDVLFQPNLLEVLMNLEELDVEDCNSLEAVFDLKDEFAKEIVVQSSSQLKKLKLSNLPKLKHVWKEDPHYTMRFQNLSDVSVVGCKNLINIFPLSVAKGMLQLQSLRVSKSGIQEIVAKEDGTEEIVKFVFPQLTSIILKHLPKLKAFFVGVHSLQCKSLKTIKLFRCPKIELFKEEPLRHQESSKNDELNISKYQPLFVIEEVLANVENLNLNNKDFDKILQTQYAGVQFNNLKHIAVCEFYNEEANFPYWFLKNVPNCESLLVQWSLFTEIFQGEQTIRMEKETQISPQLKQLKLRHLSKLQCICKEGFQMDPVLQFLESIYVYQCSSLTMLVPSSVSFSYMTFLEVTNCNGLKNLITHSTAKSLVKLATMKIKMCNWLEDIVNGKEDETNEIEFCSLQTLELTSLERLSRFCSCSCTIMFPLLEVVVVKECPRMELFSFGVTKTTNLQHVQTEEEKHWVGDLNGTIKKMFVDKVAFGSFKHLKLSEYPELKELWYGNLEHTAFRSLKYLVVHKCDFLSDVLFQPNLLEVLMNLEELDVENCNSLEAVFDLKDEFAKEIVVQNSTQLKKLKLSNLPKLKHVWKVDPHYTMRFQNLSDVSVGDCESLISLFPLSVARDMKQLQSLRVSKCGIQEIVGKEEGTNEIVKFVFPQLTSITLHCLTKLKAFFDGGHSLQCKSLKTIKLFRCPKIELFKAEPLRHQKSSRIDELNISQYQPLFVIEEVLANVENLNLNNTDFGKILQSQYSGVQFNNIKHITVCEFYTEEATFPYWFLKDVPNLETLLVKWSSFTEIFQGEQIIGTEKEPEIIPQLRKLTLWNLSKLQCICKEGFQMDPVLQFLESIYVYQCSSLTMLVPSSVSFSYMTFLEVGFGSFKHLKLSEYPELKELWYGRLENNTFRSLKYLVVHKCDFLFDVLFQPNLLEVLMNLEELDVEDCNSLEAVFDLKDEFAKEIVVQNSSQLKKLKLSNLPKLKHVWKEDPHYTMRFQNLSDVSVVGCKNLINIFPLSVAKGMLQLQSLRVSKSGIQEIVAKEDGTEEIVKFVFPQLTSIILKHLPKLKAFFVGVHSLQCKSLKTIKLFRCPKIELFKEEPLRHQESSKNDELNISKYQPLFVIEEVLANVENLNLNNKDFDKILQTQYAGVQFNNLKHIAVCEFYNEEANFPYWFLKNVPNCESLLVQWSLFTEIFQGEQTIRMEKETQISPQLKQLKLLHLSKLQCICKEGFQMDPVLQFLESIYVYQCSSLTMLVPSSVSFSYMTFLEVTNCNGLKNLITHSTAKSLVKLATMKIKMCNWLEDIVNGKEDETNEIEFCSLQTLELTSLERLSRFCSCSCTIMFPLLEVVVVKECPRMELFSFGVTKTTNLQHVQTEEEKHWVGDLNGTIKKMFVDKVAFGSFKHLKLSEYPELKELWYGNLEHTAFRSLKYLVVHKCDFLSDVLFQPNLLEVLMNLEELDVENCNSLEAVFDLKDEFAKEIVVQNSTQLKKLKLSNLPKLKHVWKVDPHYTMRFQNLSDVSVGDCESLISLFPLSVARDMKQLQSLRVSKCGIQEIVGKEEGTNEIVKFVFPQLTSITLHCLTKLKAFFDGGHSLQCKSLKTIKLFRCPKIELFKAEPLRHQKSSRIDELNISQYQPLFVIEEVLANVENLNLNNTDFGKILQSQYSGVQFNNIKHITVCEFYTEEATFPYWFLKDVPNLETLLVKWSSFTEIFQGEQIIGTEKEPEIIPQLRKLTLWNLSKLQCICKEGFQMDPVLQFLESIYVYQCSSLTMLVPSSVSFSYMTFLEVTNCNGLKKLITHSTAKSLVKLTTMKIKMCNWLEDIVNGKEDETNEIVFCSLQTLELISLQRLCRFSSCPCPIKFPLLKVVVVKECPRMELFSLGVTNTTNLQNVQTDEGNHWEGDLNRTIKKMFCDKVAFGEFVYLAFSDYPELKDVWYGQLHCNVFCNLKHLVVERCDFLSHVLFPSNVMQVLQTLEELEVKDCDSLEAVFDVKGMKSQEILIKENTQLKRLTLSTLPKLKHIWNEDPHEIISFGNLHKVDVSMCQSLLYVFPYSLCPDLGHLEMLEISSCGVKEIVAMEETVSMEIQFNFPQLKIMALRLLSNLKSFYQGKHTLDCPSLKTLNVYRCEALRMFSFNNSDLQQPYSVDQQPLFCIEKLSPNLEELAVNGKDMLGILNGYCQENIFHKVKFLHLQCFDETPTILLNDFHTIFPTVETFQVRNSSFETLFPAKGATSYLSMQMSNQIRNLWLFELDKLNHVWQEDFPLDYPLLQYLEELCVVNCPSLISLVSSSTSFTNLTHLKVDNCKELIYLIKISTAKSLVQLKALNITNCEKMLDVVKIDDDKAEENIVFENLEYLEFTSLSNLRSFCYGKQTFIFPSLLSFIVKGCPQMKIFSSALTVAPCLTSIEVEEENMRWEGDLNTTIEQMFIEKEVPLSN